MPRTIFYYQTFYTDSNEFISLKPILYDNSPITHIHLSSIHFGLNDDNSPYIHLNNRTPDNSYFDNVWKDINLAKQKGVKIIAMIGGAGGGYSSLFSNFNVFYNILRTFLKDHPDIDGVDLDIEETCDIENIKKLINNIISDFGEKYIIATAPVSASLINNEPGMGGFCYKDLLDSKEGKYIDYINCQAYYNFTKNTLDLIVKNGYDPKMIVMGMIAGEDYKDDLKDLYTFYKDNLGGIFVWEYYDTIPSPLEWCQFVESVFNNKNIINASRVCIVS